MTFVKLTGLESEKHNRASKHLGICLGIVPIKAFQLCLQSYMCGSLQVLFVEVRDRVQMRKIVDEFAKCFCRIHQQEHLKMWCHDCDSMRVFFVSRRITRHMHPRQRTIVNNC